MHIILATFLTFTQSTARNVDSLLPGQTPFAAPPQRIVEPTYAYDPDYARCLRRHERSNLCRHLVRPAG